MAKSKGITRTEESIFTLISLYVLTSQAFESLTGEEDIMYSEFGDGKNSFHHLVTDTINEALVYQIFLKTCSFLDEWNKVFGVATDSKDNDRIRIVKAVAKPAIKQINSWKELRDFRNEAIAHNHRNKEGQNIYLISKQYHRPNNLNELYLVVFCLQKAADVIKFFFREEVTLTLPKLAKKQKGKKVKVVELSLKEIKNSLNQISEAIDDTLSSIYMKEKIFDSVASTLGTEVSVTIL